LIAGSVVGAYCAPALLFRGLWEPPIFNPIPPGLVPATAAVLATLVAVAVGFGLAARQRQGSPRRTLLIALGCGLIAAAGALPLSTGGFTYVAEAGPLAVLAVAMLRRGRGGHAWRRAIAGWALCLAIAVAAWLPAVFGDFYFAIFLPAAPFSFGDIHPALAGAFSLAVLIAFMSVMLEIGRSAPAWPVTAPEVTAPESAADRGAETDDARSPSRTHPSEAAR
jgi:hypothetical protein